MSTPEVVPTHERLDDGDEVYIYDYRCSPDEDWMNHDTRSFDTPDAALAHLQTRAENWPRYEWRVVHQVTVRMVIGKATPEGFNKEKEAS